jgi:calcineurin-like phosphoesterase family protein
MEDVKPPPGPVRARWLAAIALGGLGLGLAGAAGSGASGSGAGQGGTTVAAAGSTTAGGAALDPSALLYIAAGSEVDYRIALAPRPASRTASAALSALDAARSGSGLPGASVLGPVAPELSSGWSDGGLAGDGVRRAPMRLGARDGEIRCDCATELADTTAVRVAALQVSRRFTVGPELDGLDLLLLRARYTDGLAVWINGREVIRRDLAPAPGAGDLAARPHGPEWESFYLPVTPGLLHRGDNLIAVEVRPSVRRPTPSLDLELSARAGGARIVRGPMLQRVGPTSATIAFDTDLPAKAVVEYGPTDTLGHRALSAGGGLARHHIVDLADLPAGPVHYRVIAGGETTAPIVFQTAPTAGEVVRFAVYGDVRGGHDTHAQLVAAMLDQAPDFVLATGDLVLRGTDAGDWQRFFAVTGNLLARVPYYPAAGNHDMGKSGDEQRRLSDLFALWPGPPDRPIWGTWYSFDVADLHFAMLDSNSYEHPEQLTWLQRDLAAANARGVRAIFAVTHDGPFSRATHGGNAYAVASYVPVLTRAGATLIFSGHDHIYQRGQEAGLDYIVSGGGGAPLYSARCGLSGLRRCKVDDGMRSFAKEHHYVMVTIYPEYLETCPRRADDTLLEPCTNYALKRRE